MPALLTPRKPIVKSNKGIAMMDLLYIGITAVLFVATLGLIRLFEKLMEGSK